MNVLRTMLLASAALGAVSLGTSAYAQTAPDPGPVPTSGSDTVPPIDAGQDIVVTGSRISLSGYKQPTPVTSIGVEALNRDAKTDLGDVIAQLPASGTANSPNTSNGSQSVSQGTAGLNLVNLRNLGVNRTLVLYDGMRVVPSTQSGGVDLNMLPASLVQRIDVVTAGASAAWGSDAVSGVVNILLNRRFTGLALNIEGQINDAATRKTGKIEASYGTDLFGGRAHLIVSGSYLNSPDVVEPQQTSWYNGNNLVPNPAYVAGNGQPRLIHASRVGLAVLTRGGLITSGPLRGIQFVGNGVPVPFIYGNVSGAVQTGGTYVDPALNGAANDLAVPIETETAFGHLGIDITDQITATFELNYGHSKTINGSIAYTRAGNLTINRENPYLDPSIGARMDQLGIGSFSLGTANINNIDFANGQNAATYGGVGNLRDEVDRTLFRQVFALDGSFGSGWKWNTNFQHSAINRHTHLPTDPIIANYNLAVDAVRVTTANVGTSGLPIGAIVCRSSLATPTNGCQPLNVLGENVASQAAINYINSGPAASDLKLEEYSAGASIQGQPFSTWAGPVAVVAGVEYRSESVLQTADALSYARAYAAGNFQYQKGSYHTFEGFGELEVPLLRDSVVDSLSLNAAGRVTNYSTSGTVVTWKFGLTAQLNQDIRLRGTVSRDIRAPSLDELSNPGGSSIQVVNDPFRGNAATNIYAVQKGNIALAPEVARTYSGGVVLTPRFIPGLNLSVDYYSIKINDAIVTPGFPYILAQCFAGNALYCPFIQRDASNVITQITSSPVNAASVKTSGIDFQADYSHPLFAGKVSVNVMGNYTFDTVYDQLGSIIHQAGSLNSDAPNQGLGGQPKFRANAVVTYTQGRASGSIQTRVIGAAKLNNAWVTGVDVDDNRVRPQAYLDLRASYFVDQDRKIQAYVAVDNLLNHNPPIVASSPAGQVSFFYVSTRTDIYDALGRFWRVGVRAKF